MAKSFTSTIAGSIPFDIDGEQYATKPVVPAGTLLDLGDRTDDAAVWEMLELVLDESSYERIRARARKPYVPDAPASEQPIQLPLLMELVAWIQEALSDLPKELSTGSPDGGSASAPPSTASSPSAE